LFPTFQKMGMGDLTDELPEWKSLMVSYCICHSFNEFFFYWTHRAFHTPMLYKLFHKQHHEYKGTIGIAAEHAHPVEAIFANMIPTLGGCFVVKNHPIVLVIWLACRLRETFEAHSGYCFKGSWYAMTGLSHDDEAIHHDYHHAINDGNFGSELTDFLFGTLQNFDKFGGQKEYLNRKKAFEAVSINVEPAVATIASTETSETSETAVAAKKIVRKAKSPSAKAKSSAKKEGAK
jgi:methylsterol monooxygenase